MPVLHTGDYPPGEARAFLTYDPADLSQLFHGLFSLGQVQALKDLQRFPHEAESSSIVTLLLSQ